MTASILPRARQLVGLRLFLLTLGAVVMVLPFAWLLSTSLKPDSLVLQVPPQLSLDAGLEEEEQLGRSVLEAARLTGRRAGVDVRISLIRTRNPGKALVEEAQRLHADVIYVDAAHAPLSERSLGPTISYLLAKRPCRVVVALDPSRREARAEAQRELALAARA